MFQDNYRPTKKEYIRKGLTLIGIMPSDSNIEIINYGFTRSPFRTLYFRKSALDEYLMRNRVLNNQEVRARLNDNFHKQERD